MLIKRIEMLNFRQFEGKQFIDFAVDPITNITVIMGENGAGKTTLAQAFLWALYGENDFKKKELINRDARDKMRPNDEIYVKVDLFLNHEDKDYIISRRQKFKRENSSVKDYNTEFSVAFKRNGQQEFMNEFESKRLVQNMLPKELSKFFFFDGERIKTMSDEIEQGRSRQFADAVRGLVGLTAIMNAINHLKPSQTNNTVIGRYNNKIDEAGNEKINDFSRRIANLEKEQETLENRIDEIEPQVSYYQEQIAAIKQEVLSYADAVEIRTKYNALDADIKRLLIVKKDAVKSFLAYFNKNTHAFLAKPLIEKTLTELASADKLDKGIPDMHQKTIAFLLKRGSCVCGTKLDPGSDAVKELYKLMDYLPPKSIGTMIGQYVSTSKDKNRLSETYFDMFSNSFKRIREIEDNISSKSASMSQLYNSLSDTTKVKALKDKQVEYGQKLIQFSQEIKNKTEKLGAVKKDKDYLEAEKNKLILVDEKNREYEIYRQYAYSLFNELTDTYKYQEMITRDKLEKYINEIFTQIYEDGIAIKIDEKYNIKVNVLHLGTSGDDLEKSTAQNYSVIFAFIAGIIKMAREKGQQVSNSDKEVSEDDSIFNEAAGYPLVMDAPLSSFDKKRINNICDTLPKIAQQIIFFIKDTDGEVAEAHLGDIIGAKYLVKKHTLTRSEIVGR
jgi:DNA sulfur modification protein DndD